MNNNKNKFQVVEIATRIQGWNRRAKGIPQYFGRLIHAIDFLRSLLKKHFD